MTQVSLPENQSLDHAAPRSPDEPSLATESVRRRPREMATLKVRLINLAAVIVPFAGLIAGVAMLWGVAIDWTLVAIFALMYLGTGFGITIGYHRLFTHRSFVAPKPVRALLAMLGSMAAEGPVLEWVATHRRHHQHSDDEDDPHSPHGHGETLAGVLRGMWHAHVGWLFEATPRGMARYVEDLRREPAIRFISRTFVLWVLAGLLIPAILGGVLTMSWSGALLGFIWGGLVRIFIIHHVTWSVNSVCHLWGERTFRTSDESRDNAIVGVLALGEGWHNSHHAFPTSARHGLAWWQIDISYLAIRAMALVGLARDIKVPSRERIEAKRRTSG